MATYIMSDIHGEYDLFIELMKKIGFRDSDELIIVGDIVDKGCQSIKLVNFLSGKKNVRAVRGNHEDAFLKLYEMYMRRLDDGDDVNCVLEKLQEFFPSDEEKLSWDVVDYIENLPLFIEEDEFICVHAGVQLDKNKQIIPLKQQNINYFLFDRSFKNSAIIPKNSKTVFFGHTPCFYDNETGEFIKTPREGATDLRDFRSYAKIQLDCGVFCRGLLGVLRLDDMSEFYVKKI